MRLISTFVPLAVLLGIPACTSEAASSPVGTYSVTLDTTSMPAEAASMMQVMTYSDLHLNADSTWDLSVDIDMMGQKRTNVITGTWVLEGSEIVMTAIEQNGQPMVVPEVTRSAYADGAFSMIQEGGVETFKMNMKKKDS
jgi:hypothetical protein